MIIETKDNLTEDQALEFQSWFHENVGTSCHIYESGSGNPDEYYLLMADVEPGTEYYAVKEYMEETGIEFAE